MEAFYVTFLIACLIAAFCDFLVFKIPNEVLLFLVALFILKVTLFQTFKDLLWPLMVFSSVLGVGFILYLFKWIGAGDAKFVAVASLWLSEVNVFLFLIAMSIAGGALGVAYLKFSPLIFAGQQKVLATINGLPYLNKLFIFSESRTVTPSQADGSKKTMRPVIPYGVAIFIGASLAILINK